MPDPWHGINDPGYWVKPQAMPADNARVVYKTDPVPEPKKDPPPTEVKLSQGMFLPPDGGLKFNDKCKVQVKVEYLRETSLKKITFNLFCTYNGKTEAMKPDKEGFEKNGIAEAEFQLFYPEDYKQGDKAEFYFKASHRRGEKIVESDKLTLPKTKSGNYGGFELQQGDNDKKKKRGGKNETSEGAYVEELQKDLVFTGYWVSDANKNDGMQCDGDFGLKTKGAILTFQKEHGLKETGSVTSETATKLKECTKQSNYSRPSHKTDNYGEFIQLPPSKSYSRLNADYDNDGVMIDNWGTKSMIDAVKKSAESWVAKGNGTLLIGDISKYNGGKFPPHAGHQDGTGADCPTLVYCALNKAGFNKEKSLELAKLIVDNGATRILFNCKYVSDKSDCVYGYPGHDNHFHIDTSATIQPNNHEKNLCKGCLSYAQCDYKEKASIT